MTLTLSPTFRFRMEVNLQTENFLSGNYQEMCQVQQCDVVALSAILPRHWPGSGLLSVMVEDSRDI